MCEMNVNGRRYPGAKCPAKRTHLEPRYKITKISNKALYCPVLSPALPCPCSYPTPWVCVHACVRACVDPK